MLGRPRQKLWQDRGGIFTEGAVRFFAKCAVESDPLLLEVDGDQSHRADEGYLRWKTGNPFEDTVDLSTRLRQSINVVFEPRIQSPIVFQLSLTRDCLLIQLLKRKANTRQHVVRFGGDLAMSLQSTYRRLRSISAKGRLAVRSCGSKKGRCACKAWSNGNQPGKRSAALTSTLSPQCGFGPTRSRHIKDPNRHGLELTGGSCACKPPDPCLEHPRPCHANSTRR